VEPLDAAALMVPTARAGEGPEPEPADFIVAFIPTAPRSAVFTMDFVVASSAIVFTVASSATIFSTASSATFAVTTSSTAFDTVDSSVVLTSVAFSAIADVAAEASLATEVDPSPSDPLGAINAAALGSGRGAVTTVGAFYPNDGGPLSADSPLWNGLILLCRGTPSSSDDTSVSLSTIRGVTLAFPLLESGLVLMLP
jgi:hypothetical protein